MADVSASMRRSSAGTPSLQPPTRAASYQPQTDVDPAVLSERSKSVDPGMPSLAPPVSRSTKDEEAEYAVPAVIEEEDDDNHVVDIEDDEQPSTKFVDDENNVGPPPATGLELWGLRAGVFSPFALGLAGIILFAVKLSDE